MKIKEPIFCVVCGSKRAGCPSLARATQYEGMWCPELEKALDKAPPRHVVEPRRVRSNKGR
jgi:hypothetical protein